MMYKLTFIVVMLYATVSFSQDSDIVEELPYQDTVSKEEIEEVKKELNTVKANIADAKTLRKETDLLWMCIASFLVFFMQAGFGLVEAGFTREKNTVNILMKNLTDFSIASIFFWIIGFSIMFGPQLIDGFGIGGIHTTDSLLNTDGKPDSYKYGFLLFQIVFAGTAATIVSGAAAERMKFPAYLCFSLLLTAFVYPVFGSFAWSGLFDPANQGFLEKMGFIDFAGSTVVHSIGGWAGLVATIIIGPRIGKFSPGGIAHPILGHNMTIATLGVFILWLGWFGFNAGSTTSVKDGSFAIIAVTTNAAAAAGFVGSLATSWILFKMPDISMSLNGILAGLVSITAGCASVSIGSALIIGLISGILVVFGVVFFDKVRVDDPVGAISVHGLCGLWGTLAVGFFAQENFGGVNGLFYGGGFRLLGVQFLGALVAFVWTVISCGILFYIVKLTIGVRVSEEEEIAGLDVLEHGNEAYPISK